MPAHACCSPMVLPTSASPAYANPSIKNEKSMNNFIISDEAANSTSPYELLMAVQPTYTIMKHSDRINKSLFRRKNRELLANRLTDDPRIRKKPKLPI